MGKIFVISLCIGLFFIAYDFIVFLLPAMLFLLIYRKKYEVLPVAITGMLLVTAIWWCFVHFVLRTSFESQNTVFYADVAQSYCSPIDFTRWMESLKKLPSLIMANFIFSCFLFLPILFLFFLILGYSKRLRLHAFEACLFISIALVFLFINCAPPYDKPWDMHGDWIARLYEPMFVVMLFYCVRFIQSLKNSQQTRFRKWLFTCALVSATAGNGIVSFGPALNDPAGISSTIYWKFYKHAPKETMKKNLAKYGRRPWGFCQ